MNTHLLKNLFTVRTCLTALISLAICSVMNAQNIFINEINGNDKWLELYNAEDNAVDISGFKLEKIDEKNVSTFWNIPEGTTIEPKGFISWEQGDDADQTFTWGISAKKDVTFKIYDKQNTELDYFSVTEDLYHENFNQTVGRETDGADKLVIFVTNGTRNTSNNAGIVKIPTEKPLKIFVNEISGNQKWLEIYNAEDMEADISGYILEKIDENNKSDYWTIPEGTTLEAKGFVFWTQQKENTDGSTFTWGISAKKDVAFKIYDVQATELDFFQIGEDLYHEGNDKTVGRETDGADKLVIFLEGTPGASNNPQEGRAAIYINEISGNDKWLELYNAEDTDVDISNYTLEKIDENGESAYWTIPDGTTLEANGFIFWIQDKENTDGSTFTWGISAKKDVAFKIYDTYNNLVDYFEVGSSLFHEGFDQTVGRTTDGAGELVIFSVGSPGASNNDGTIKTPTTVENKIYINEISGNDKWLELYNDDDSVVDISGYVLQKIDETNKTTNWTIPAGTTITAKGFISWEQGDDEQVTFTWGISARKDIGFKIFDTEGNELDYFEIKYDLFSSGGNRTVGRITDGADELVVFSVGTRDASNNNGTVKIPTENPKKIYVNEISGNEKWLEIYNGEDHEIDLTGYFLEKLDSNPNTGDYPAEVNIWFIPDGTKIGPKGFIDWEQGNDEEVSFTWGISAKKDVGFKIYDNNGTELNFFWAGQDLYHDGNNQTVGRESDGADKLVIFQNGGTRGKTNAPEESVSDIQLNENKMFAVVKDRVIYLSDEVKAASVINICGLTVKSSKTVLSNTIDTNNLSKGIYLIKMVSSENQIKVQKILIP